MRCTRCGTELIAGKKFCHACGTRASRLCPGCGVSVAPEFRFCPDCGLALAPEGLPDVPPPTDPHLLRQMPEGLAYKIRAAQDAVEGERKQVTVLFCDLAGSTAIAERLDPEEYADLLDEYLALAFREIYGLEGIVTYSAGDGLMALFGAPVAHEDAPQRAIRAALAINDALARLNERLRAERGLDLHARIGIHTGPVVVGTVGNDLKMDYTAIGDTTNLASRLEALAAPGTILVSEPTYRLVRGFFRVRAAGPFTVKGKTDPVPAYEVLGETAAATRMTIAAERGLTPLVGRDEELAQLDACFRRLGGNLAQVVVVVGEAGLGKSRLLYEFRRRLDGEQVTFFEGRCSALGQGAPFFPFVTMLKQYFGLAPDDTVEAACAKVSAVLGDGSAEMAEQEYPALSRLLGLRRASAGEPEAEALKRETFDAVTRLLVAESDEAPVVMMVEDLHWLDDASRELLETVVSRLERARVMVVVTHRPEDRAGWRTRAALTQLVLRRLSDDDVRTVFRAVAGGALPEQLEHLLVAKAEGSPFCAEEITRSLVEEGYLVQNGGGRKLTRPIEEIRIPGTVQEVIAARLDRLPAAAKRVVQVAAVLGRQFRRDQLARLLASEGIDVDGALAGLEERGIFHRKSIVARDEYRFGESLTQEVAYEGLLLRQRRQLHERIATLLAEEPGEVTAERSAVLAHHLARSDNRAKAVDALLAAGQAAERLPSFRTAIDFYRRAWELADGQPTDERYEPAALAASAAISRLGALYGWPGLDETERATRRALDLSRKLHDAETEAGLTYFLGVMTILRGEFSDGLAIVEQSVTMAQQAGLELSRLKLARGLAINNAFDGRFDVALRTIDWIIAELKRLEADQLGDVYVSALWIRDNVLYFQDDLDAAYASAQQTVALARRVPNRTVTSGAASTLAQIQFLRGEYDEALQWADEALAVAEAIGNITGFPAPAAIALASRVELGKPTDAQRYLELIDQAFAAGSTMQTSFRFIADGLLAVHDLERAARFVDALREHPIRTGRLRDAFTSAALGELLLRLGRDAEAERTFGHAMGLAELIGSRTTFAAAALGCAELAAARGDRRASLVYAERSLAIVRALSLRRYLPRLERIIRQPDAASRIEEGG
jgi:class 3 adenylate cyclase/tetratricopeptide (TPR) repeat protein/ABC-type lipoprotein export system ATPase subunit